MQKTTLCLLACIWASSLSAQQKIWEVSGIVRSDLSQSVPGVSILLDDTLRCTTDEYGFFQTRLPYRPRILTTTRVGYEPIKIRLRDYPAREKSIYLDLEILALNKVLPEFMVSAKSIEKIFKEDYEHQMVDFELIGKDQMLLLAKNKNQFALQLTDDVGNLTAVIELPGHQDFSQIHKGCLGTYHVPGIDWTYEVKVEDGQLDTLGKYPRREFDTYIVPCVAHHNDCFFFENRLYNGNAIQFEWVDPAGIIHPLLNVYDEETFNRLIQDVRDFHRKNSYEARDAYFEEVERKKELMRNARLPNAIDIDPYDSKLVKLPNNTAPKEDIRMTALQAAYYKRIQPIPQMVQDSLYVPMFNIGDSLFLFNHKQNVLLRLEPDAKEGRVFRAYQTPLTYHREKGWRKQVVVDAFTNRAYGVFRKYMQGLTLKEVDFETGAAGKTYVVGDAPQLCKEYKVRNGKLYFLGQPDPNVPNYQLFKVDLSRFSQK